MYVKEGGHCTEWRATKWFYYCIKVLAQSFPTGYKQFPVHLYSVTSRCWIPNCSVILLHPSSFLLWLMFVLPKQGKLRPQLHCSRYFLIKTFSSSLEKTFSFGLTAPFTIERGCSLKVWALLLSSESYSRGTYCLPCESWLKKKVNIECLLNAEKWEIHRISTEYMTRVRIL